MINKVKIKISETAYNKLLNILNGEDKDLCIRFSYRKGCCKSSKIDIILDRPSYKDITDYIDELPIIYDSQLVKNINEVTLIYKNNSFMIKTILNKIKDCDNCIEGCNASNNGINKCNLESCSKQK